jgi:uncharacterized membrane protein YphA (DoxX/SURF4 family)
MEISSNIRRAPLRLSTGAFVVNSGISTFNADDETTKRLQTTAARLVPQVERMQPRTFARVLAAGEVTLGTALMLPVVPAAVAGLGLSAFAASLLAAERPTNGQHANGKGEPTTQATPTATEAWMLGAGVSLLLDALTSPAHDKSVEVSARLHEKAAARKRHLRRSRRRAAALAAVSAANLGGKAHVAGDRLRDAGELVGERVTELRDEYQPVAAKKLKKAKKKARKQAKSVAATARESAEGASQRIQQQLAS